MSRSEEDNLVFICYFDRKEQDKTSEWKEKTFVHFRDGIKEDETKFFDTATCNAGNVFNGVKMIKDDLMAFYITSNYNIHNGVVKFFFPKQIFNLTKRLYYKWDFKKKKMVNLEYPNS